MATKKKSAVEIANTNGFTQGVAYSVAQLLRYGSRNLASYIYEEAGISTTEMKDAGVDAYDLDPIREMVSENS